jgi:hypothetical protein
MVVDYFSSLCVKLFFAIYIYSLYFPIKVSKKFVITNGINLVKILVVKVSDCITKRKVTISDN